MRTVAFWFPSHAFPHSSLCWVLLCPWNHLCYGFSSSSLGRHVFDDVWLKEWFFPNLSCTASSMASFQFLPEFRAEICYWNAEPSTPYFLVEKYTFWVWVLPSLVFPGIDVLWLRGWAEQGLWHSGAEGLEILAKQREQTWNKGRKKKKRRVIIPCTTTPLTLSTQQLRWFPPHLPIPYLWSHLHSWPQGRSPNPDWILQSERAASPETILPH